MGQYDFLKSLKLKEETTDKSKTEKNPSHLGIRIFANGKVFPSKELVEKFKLQYGVSGECGIDFFSSKDWKPYPAGQPPIVLVAFVPRTAKKLSLFARTRSTSQTETKTDVLTQGTKSPELLELIRETYKPETSIFYDLVIDTDLALNTEDGIYLIPKTYIKGKDAGKPTYERRENITLYPLIPTNLIDSPSTEVEQVDRIAELNSI